MNEWDGDNDYGWYKQHCCNRCGGYVGNPNDDVDRYLPQDQRRPDLIKGNPVNPWNRQKEQEIDDVQEGIFAVHAEEDFWKNYNR